VRDAYREQARLLADAGVDLLFLEMTQDIDVGIAAVEGASEAGLPIWVAFSCNFMSSLQGSARPVVAQDRNGKEYPFEELIGPVSAYPNSGDWTPPNWGFDTVISPKDFVAVAVRSS